MYELGKREFDTWAEVPQGALVKGRTALYIKLDNGTAAFTTDVNSLGGWSGGWITLSSSEADRHGGPFEATGAVKL